MRMQLWLVGTEMQFLDLFSLFKMFGISKTVELLIHSNIFSSKICSSVSKLSM